MNRLRLLWRYLGRAGQLATETGGHSLRYLLPGLFQETLPESEQSLQPSAEISSEGSEVGAGKSGRATLSKAAAKLGLVPWVMRDDRKFLTGRTMGSRFHFTKLFDCCRRKIGGSVRSLGESEDDEDQGRVSACSPGWL